MGVDRTASTHVDGAPLDQDSTADVVVLGAGLAGLTAATTAARTGARALVLDGRPAGGRAAVTVTGSGAVFNSGPRALYQGGAGLRVLRSLGIEPIGRPAPTDGHAILGGEVHRLPSGPVLLMRSSLLGARSKLRVARLLGGLQRLDAARYDDWSLRRWLDHRGLDGADRSLMLGVVRTATYVDDVDQLSAGVAIRQVQLALGDGVLYLDGGWQQLVDALVGELEAHGGVVEKEAVLRIEAGRTDAATWTVHTSTRHIHAASVVVATGGPDAVAGVLPVELDRSGLGPPATAACLELALRRRPPVPFLMGLDEPLYLSTHTPAARLAPEGVEVVHVMRYGARSSSEDRAQLWAHARTAGIDAEDVLDERFLHRMVVTGGIPVAAAGGYAGRPSVQCGRAPGLFVAGDWVGDEGLLGDAAMSSGARAGTFAATFAHERAASTPGLPTDAALTG